MASLAEGKHKPIIEDYTKIVCRTARCTDLERVVELLDELALHIYALRSKPKQCNDQERRESRIAMIQTMLKDESNQTILARDSVKAVDVGLIMVQVHRVVDDTIGSNICRAVVSNLVVRKEYRGQGIGKNLLVQGASWARTQGATELGLSVRDGNYEALDFYERIGFRVALKWMILDVDELIARTPRQFQATLDNI